MRFLVISAALSLSAGAFGQDARIEFFEAKIRPVLVEHCYECHGAQKQKGGVRVDGREYLTKDVEDGPLVVAGDAKRGRLMKALRHDGDIKMPPKGKLPANVLADLATWIADGAAWPQSTTSVAAGDPAKTHWAFQPVRIPPLPEVKDQAWSANPIDRFILARLEAKDIPPNAPADPHTLLRRLKFDLLGLPLTEAEAVEFARDSSPEAYARWVERYLNSPHYGERWGRHWLDVARYADNKGYVFTEERRYPFAYTYRDYVVRAFNEDLPYDRFVLEQLAADRLVAKGQAEPASQAAMGFLTLGRRFLNNVHDIIDDRIDVVSRGLLGLTVTCARCHDHKYDPIPIKDYYSLYGVFASSVEPKELPLLGESEKNAETLAFEKSLAELEAAVVTFQKENEKPLKEKQRDVVNTLKKLQMKVDGFKASSPAAPPRGMVLVDDIKPSEPRVFVRGNPNNPGPTVPRQFLAVLGGEKRQPFTDGSGRLELAHAIASPDNPLTARVLVNRLWLHHFGAGLVASPSNFGLRSDPPSHPELLDYLAHRFMTEGWSIKKLHRLILTSNTYRLSSAENTRARQIDPENRLLARAPRRRLDFETMRDSILFASGQLDLKLGGRAVDIVSMPTVPRRTLYGFIDRQNLPGMFRTFDFANPDVSNAQRYQTTVPQQALFLLNSPFLLEQAKHLLTRPEIAGESETAARIDALYRTLFARRALPEEIALGCRLLETPVLGRGDAPSPWERYGQVLLLTNEFFFVD
jgi:hypothetical protein